MSTKSKQRKQRKNASITQLSIDSGSQKRNRSQGKYQWVDSNDDVEEQWNDKQEVTNYIQTQWKEIYQAINDNNPDLLYTLLPPVNLYNTKEKYWKEWNSYEHSRGEEILFRAVQLQHTDCVKVIVDKVRNKDLPESIINYDDSSTHDRTPLLIACEKGNLNIVQMLVECGCQLSFLTNAFFIAFEQGHQSIMNYLVTKFNFRKSENNVGTALDCVISRGYIETAKLLIHYGDTKRNRDGFSPMMLAAHHHLTPLVDLLFQRLPLQEALDELMLLACHYVIRGGINNRQKAFDLFVRGLTEGEVPENGASNEAYEYRAECKTVDELVSIWDDDNAMRMYSLVVSERILLRLGDVDALLKLINRQCHFYRNNRSFHRCLQMRIHARHIVRNGRFDWVLPYWWYRGFLDKLEEDFDIVWNETKTVPMEWIEFMSTCVFDERVFYSFHIFHRLETIVYMIHLVTTERQQRRSLFNLARRAMRHDTRGNSLLVNYISRFRRDPSGDYVPAFKYVVSWEKEMKNCLLMLSVSPLSVVELMIRCGANVNGIGRYCWTDSRPLHAATGVSNVDVAKSMIKLLLTRGAHADCIDETGKFAQDCTNEPVMKELLSVTRNLSLKCRCAQIIASQNINCETVLPVHVVDFVRLHSNPEVELLE